MPRLGRDIDDRLEDLDRRLREIQKELLPGREPRPVATAPQSTPPSPGPPPAEPAPPDPPPPPEQPPPPPPPPPPGLPPPRGRPPGPPPPHGPLPSTGQLTGLHAKLLASFRELLDAYEYLLAQMADPPPPDPPAQTAGVTAGPFASTESVRAFEAALGSVPGVRSVTVRGYEGDDRAIFDVEFGQA